nr:substrate-binding domain-containing protein [Treponemataceae bacterium]
MKHACSALCAAVLFFSGCSELKAPEPAGIPQEPKRVTIGFSLDSLIVERWIRDRDVFVSTASSLGADVIFQNAANNPSAQVAQVKYLIDKGVDVLVIIPQNAEMLAESVQKARSRGIKVISYDRLIRNAGVDLYISVNSMEVGRIMASAIIREAPAGNYVFIY